MLEGGFPLRRQTTPPNLPAMVNLTVVFFILVSLVHGFLSVVRQSKTEDSNVIITTEVSPETENSTLRVLSRKRRYVVFPHGSSIQCVYKENIRLYMPFYKKFKCGISLALAWKLPTEAHEIYLQKRDVDHTRAALARAGYGVQHRVDMYKMLEGLLSLKGLKGRDCLMRAVCEASEAIQNQTISGKYQGTLMEELHKILFTLPLHPGHKTDYDKAREFAGKCNKHYAGCHSILDLEL